MIRVILYNDDVFFQDLRKFHLNCTMDFLTRWELWKLRFQDLARQNGSLPLVIKGEPSDNIGWS